MASQVGGTNHGYYSVSPYLQVMDPFGSPARFRHRSHSDRQILQPPQRTLSSEGSPKWYEVVCDAGWGTADDRADAISIDSNGNVVVGGTYASSSLTIDPTNTTRLGRLTPMDSSSNSAAQGLISGSSKLVAPVWTQFHRSLLTRMETYMLWSIPNSVGVARRQIYTWYQPTTTHS